MRPWVLVLVPVVTGIWWLWRRNSDPLRGWRAQMDSALLTALADQPDSKVRKHFPMLLVWLLAVFALAGPSWRPEPSPFSEDASPLVILLKADTSMDVPDPEPSRMERAHLKIRDLAAARKGQPMGLIAYAGSAHLVLPPTRDTNVVAGMAAEISPKIMPEPGDRLDLAIAEAAKICEGGSLLIVSDTAVAAMPGVGQAIGEAGSPTTQILAITKMDPAPLEPLAKSMHASLVRMTADDRDIDRIVRGAAREQVAQGGDGTVRWQDGGYYLVPVLAVFALFPFRRESSGKEAV